MMKTILLLSVIALTYPLLSVAENSPVYESLSGVRIGRVFLTQNERDLLDARRLVEPQGGSFREVISDAPAKSKPLASAGYIIGRHGRSKVWKNGDFVESRNDPEVSVSFPGDVKITRHAASDKPSDTDDKKVIRGEQPEDDDG